MASAIFGGDWTPPPVAITWKAYEAAYPKKSVSGAALEIESLAARLGIDMAPQGPSVVDPDDENKLVQLRPDDGRVRPDPELVKRTGSTISAVGHWAEQELAEPSARIGPPVEAVERFFDENAATVDAIAAVASGSRPIEWDLDVALRSEAPLPNLLGLSRLQRVLAARALLQLRTGDDGSGLATIEGMWRLAASLGDQPYLISQLIALSQVRLVAGLLRKVDAPAYGWEQRLRQQPFYDAFLAALQNDPWPMGADPELAAQVETVTRIYRRFVEGLAEKSLCDWTKESLTHSWQVAASAENATDEMIATVVWDSIVDMLPRAQRLLLDSELTALVLQARAEKDASREGEWPARLPNLESSVCPGRFYSYKRAGGVTVAFEGPLPAEGEQAWPGPSDDIPRPAAADPDTHCEARDPDADSSSSAVLLEPGERSDVGRLLRQESLRDLRRVAPQLRHGGRLPEPRLQQRSDQEDRLGRPAVGVEERESSDNVEPRDRCASGTTSPRCRERRAAGRPDAARRSTGPCS